MPFLNVVIMYGSYCNVAFYLTCKIYYIRVNLLDFFSINCEFFVYFNKWGQVVLLRKPENCNILKLFIF